MKKNAKSLQLIEKGFELGKKEGIHIPILQNNEGVTPIDVVLEVEQTEYKFFNHPKIIDPLDDHSKVSEKEQRLNVLAATKFFDNIKDYCYLHGSPYLASAVNSAISASVSGIGDYL